MTKTTTAVSLPTDPVTVVPWTEGSIQGKVVAMRAQSGWEGTLVLASGGFGCSLTTMGGSVFGMDDGGEHERWSRNSVKGIATGPRAEAFAAILGAWDASDEKNSTALEKRDAAFAAFATDRGFVLRTKEKVV